MNGVAGRKRVAISVEAKADEPFGERVSDVLQRAAGAIANEEWTNATQRVQQLGRALFHQRDEENAPRLGDLRYQLLTASGGALAHARECNADSAVLVVHEFAGPAVREAAVSANADDLDAFVNRVSRGQVRRLLPGTIEGPFTVPGNAHIPSIPLYVAKLRTELNPSAGDALSWRFG